MGAKSVKKVLRSQKGRIPEDAAFLVAAGVGLFPATGMVIP